MLIKYKYIIWYGIHYGVTLDPVVSHWFVIMKDVDL